VRARFSSLFSVGSSPTVQRTNPPGGGYQRPGYPRWANDDNTREPPSTDFTPPQDLSCPTGVVPKDDRPRESCPPHG